MGELVDQHPGAELDRVEPEALLQRRQVRADEVDGTVSASVRCVAAHEEVVLAEHAAAHPSEHQPELDAGHLLRP